MDDFSSVYDAIMTLKARGVPTSVLDKMGDHYIQHFLAYMHMHHQPDDLFDTLPQEKRLDYLLDLKKPSSCRGRSKRQIGKRAWHFSEKRQIEQLHRTMFKLPMDHLITKEC